MSHCLTLHLLISSTVLCRHAEKVAVNGDGEDVIKVAFMESTFKAKLIWQTCPRHGVWSSATEKEKGTSYGTPAAEKFGNYCATACCEAEFRDRCEKFAVEQVLLKHTHTCTHAHTHITITITTQSHDHSLDHRSKPETPDEQLSHAKNVRMVKGIGTTPQRSWADNLRQG